MRDIDYLRPSTWISYSRADCQKCHGDCCRLPVEVSHSDLVRMDLATAEELEWDERVVIKRLKKNHIIRLYDQKNKIATLTQMADSRCLFLDEKGRCKIYEKRPNTCRKFPEVGPRPDYCPFKAKLV